MEGRVEPRFPAMPPPWQGEPPPKRYEIRFVYGGVARSREAAGEDQRDDAIRDLIANGVSEYEIVDLPDALV